MKNPTNWTYTSVPQPVLIDRGFTGHENYDNFGLIDMNGRMYDPVLGRFLGVDPIIQDAGNSQSINGYGYCLNNPLIYTDPSGYSYQQTLRDLYIGSGYYYYRGGIYNYSSEDGWQYFQPSLSGGMAPAANISYDALHPDTFHYDQQGNLRDYFGNILKYHAQIESEIKTATLLPPNSSVFLMGCTRTCGSNKWKLLKNRTAAEEYLKENESCKKEKFFYVLSNGNVLVGPWIDATPSQVSGRWLDHFSNGYVHYRKDSYAVDYFVHTHPNNPNPSIADKDNYDYFSTWGISTLIYYKGNYYLFTHKLQGQFIFE